MHSTHAGNKILFLRLRKSRNNPILHEPHSNRTGFSCATAASPVLLQSAATLTHTIFQGVSQNNWPHLLQHCPTMNDASHSLHHFLYM